MKFSIITPSYNQLDWLKLCTASVRDQVNEDDRIEVEHILQDGGTTGIEAIADGGLRIADLPRYQLRLFIEKDDGMYDAINRGLERAGGNVCAWLNCDEQYLPGALSKIARAFEADSDVEMLFSDVILVDGAGTPLSYRHTILPDRLHLRLNQLNTPSCGMFFRKSVWDCGLRFDPQWKAIGDAVWVESALTRGVRMAVLDEPVAVFAFTGANLSGEGRAAQEMLHWRQAPDAPPSWMRLATRLLHQARKLRAGAYRLRDIDYAVYTKESPHRRQRFSARGIGYSWPRTDTSAEASRSA